MRSRSKAGLIAFLTVWSLVFVGAIAGAIGIVYVAIHFIQKFW